MRMLASNKFALPHRPFPVTMVIVASCTGPPAVSWSLVFFFFLSLPRAPNATSAHVRDPVC